MTGEAGVPESATKRPFRFSLRQSILLITFICICAGIVVAPRWRKKEYHARWGARGGVVNGEAIDHASVSRLNLANDGLTELPEDIWKLSNLQIIVLSCRNVRSVPAEIGKLEKLTSLHLLYMPVNSLPPEIGQLSKLRDLHLDYTQLTSLPAEIRHLRNLRRLDLQGSAINDADLEHLKPLANLEQVWLQRTNVSEDAVKSLKKSLPNCEIASDY